MQSGFVSQSKTLYFSIDSITTPFAAKELWEPIISSLFSLQDTDSIGPNSGLRVNIHEIWTIESPNHGRSAALNDKLLLNGDHILSTPPVLTPFLVHNSWFLVASSVHSLC